MMSTFVVDQNSVPYAPVTFCMIVYFYSILSPRYVMAGLSTGSIVVYNIDFTRWSNDYQARYQR